MRRLQVQEDGIRLDKFIALSLNSPRSHARRLIVAGRVYVGGKVVRIMTRPLKMGAWVEISAYEADAVPTVQSAELPVLFCDRYILVLNKPAGLLSEDDRYSDNSVESMAPELLASLDEKKTELWLVHRLDAGTSGVLIMARTPMASGSLGKAFHDKQAKKTYWALCQGTPEHATFEVDGPIGRVKGTQHAVIPSGRPALTKFRVHNAKNGFCWIEAMPETGRTHQIRVHLAHVGLPIVGDKLYGGTRYIEHDNKRHLVPRTMLHARCLRVRHPKSGEKMTFEAPMPDDFRDILSLLDFSC